MLLPTRIVRCAINAIGDAITVAITVACVGNAVAVAVAHRAVAIPAAAFIHPAAFTFGPATRVIVIAVALAFPMSFVPDMAIAAPIPVAGCPDVTGAIRWHHFIA